VVADGTETKSGPLRVLVKTTWGSDDPTRSALAFNHSNALAAHGHEVQIFLIGEAVSVARRPVREAIVPIGWPPLRETIAKTVAAGIKIHVCGVCSAARGVVQDDLDELNAVFGSPESFVGLIEWADKILAE
jgi:predicted peroxiredoxin